MEINYQDGFNKDLIQWPFGYGLSYTNYTYSNFKMNPSVHISENSFDISFELKNSGKIDGTEVVQLYVSPTVAGSTLKPIALKGFQRVDLKAGEQKMVKFKVSPQQLVQYINKEWVVEPGNYEFKIGASSNDIKLKGTIEMKGNKLILNKGRQVFFSECSVRNNFV